MVIEMWDYGSSVKIISNISWGISIRVGCVEILLLFHIVLVNSVKILTHSFCQPACIIRILIFTHIFIYNFTSFEPHAPVSVLSSSLSHGVYGLFFLRSFFLWSIIVTAKAILFTFNHNPQSQSESPIWCDWLSTHSVCTLYNIWDVWLSRLSVTDSKTLSPFSKFFMLVLWYVLFVRSFVRSFVHSCIDHIVYICWVKRCDDWDSCFLSVSTLKSIFSKNSKDFRWQQKWKTHTHFTATTVLIIHFDMWLIQVKIVSDCTGKERDMQTEHSHNNITAIQRQIFGWTMWKLFSVTVEYFKSLAVNECGKS